MDFVELLDIIEQKYQHKQSTTILGSIGGSHLKYHFCLVFWSTNTNGSVSFTGVLELENGGVGGIWNGLNA
jgi:hypothetical protein